MKMREQITYEETYAGFPIMTDKERGLGCKVRILEKIKAVMDDALEAHNKVFFMRLDLRFPQDSRDNIDNKAFCRFQAEYIKALQKQDYDPRYVAVREQSEEKKQHYHEALLLNGNKVQSIHRPIELAEELWRKTLNQPQGKGLVDACLRNRKGEPHRNGVMLRRDDPEFKENRDHCFRRASYLAKVNQKNTPDGQRELFGSQIAECNEKERCLN